MQALLRHRLSAAHTRQLASMSWNAPVHMSPPHREQSSAAAAVVCAVAQTSAGQLGQETLAVVGRLGVVMLAATTATSELHTYRQQLPAVAGSSSSSSGNTEYCWAHIEHVAFIPTTTGCTACCREQASGSPKLTIQPHSELQVVSNALSGP